MILEAFPVDAGAYGVFLNGDWFDRGRAKKDSIWLKRDKMWIIKKIEKNMLKLLESLIKEIINYHLIA